MDEIRNIPLIIPNFNQLTYLKNLVLWFKWYYPNNEIFVLDNGSTYQPLLDYYLNCKDFELIYHPINDCPTNLRNFIDMMDFEWYIISDPDVCPHPATPPNFLEYFKAAIEQGYHHAGFDIITEDLPSWLYKKEHIIGDEAMCRVEEVEFMGVKGCRGAIDTTFCLYRRSNGGWTSPMNGKDWTNGLRLFKAFHYKFYQHKDYINPELDNYFKTANYRDFTKPSAGVNYFRPPQYE